MMTPQTVLLDPGYSAALVSQARREGFARPTSRGQWLRGERLPEVEALFRYSPRARKVLPYVLLYPSIRVFYDDFHLDALDLTSLSKHLDWANVRPEMTGSVPCRPDSPRGVELAMFFKPVIMARFRRLGGSKLSEAYYEGVVRAHLEAGGKTFPFLADERLLLLEAERVAVLERRSPEEIIAELEDVEVLKERGLAYLSFTLSLLREIKNTIAMFSYSDQAECPIASSVAFSSRTLKQADTSTAVETNDLLLGCYRVFVEEVQHFPDPPSLESALRLRDDKRCQAWRDALHGWAQRIREGDRKGEAEMRRCIRQAVRDLERLVPFKRTNRFFTLLGIPVAAAEMFVGIPGLGLTLTGASTAFETATMVQERKHKWLLFGREG